MEVHYISYIKIDVDQILKKKFLLQLSGPEIMEGKIDTVFLADYTPAYLTHDGLSIIHGSYDDDRDTSVIVNASRFVVNFMYPRVWSIDDFEMLLTALRDDHNIYSLLGLNKRDIIFKHNLVGRDLRSMAIDIATKKQYSSLRIDVLCGLWERTDIIIGG